jgi:hypothetical protein
MRRSNVPSVLAWAGLLTIILQLLSIGCLTLDTREGISLSPYVAKPLGYSLNVSKEDHDEYTIIVAGLIPDGASIKSDMLTTLAQLSCMYGSRIHVTVAENAPVFQDLFHRQTSDLYRPEKTNIQCQPLVIVTQPALPSSVLFRTEKLAFLRDFQRQQLRDIVDVESNFATSTDNSIIMLMDLDLLEVPPAFQIMNAASLILKGDATEKGKPPTLRVDAICAGGVIVDDQSGREGYYDSFATIFKPDTYMLQLSRRQKSAIRPGENSTLILAENDANFYTLWEWMRQQQSIPVRSCFGGLALYRANKFLDKRCTYSAPAALLDMTGYEGREGFCEHVVFNTCLSSVADVQIVILPSLRTRWVQNDALTIPIDLNSALTKFMRVEDKRINERKTNKQKEAVSLKQLIDAGAVSLAQIKGGHTIRKGDRLIVFKPGPLFGKEASVVLITGDIIHVKVGPELIPMRREDLAIVKRRQ